jgi:repressor LexA
MAAEYTGQQGQYIAFIHHYTQVNGRPPAEADKRWYFRVSTPTVHHMVLNLEKRGLSTGVPGQPRSIRPVIPHEKLPALD